jgi:ribosomal protein S18 acetylase RimI-like enzyme
MLIRPATPADSASLAELYLRARLAAFTWMNPADFHRDDFYRHTEGEIIHLAEDPHGAIVGFLSLWEPDQFIHHLFISPDHLRQGIGRSLLADLQRRLPARFRLKCLVANRPAIAFYRSLGWAEIERGSGPEGEFLLLHSPPASRADGPLTRKSTSPP